MHIDIAMLLDDIAGLIQHLLYFKGLEANEHDSFQQFQHDYIFCIH